MMSKEAVDNWLSDAQNLAHMGACSLASTTDANTVLLRSIAESNLVIAYLLKEIVIKEPEKKDGE